MIEEQLIEQFQALEDDFNEAWTSNNTERISTFISDDWFLLEPQFGIVSREKFLRVIENAELSHVSMKKKVMQVKLLGDVAIVTARGFNKGSFRGEVFDAELWVTNIYKRENRNWICIMTQEAPVSCGKKI